MIKNTSVSMVNTYGFYTINGHSVVDFKEDDSQNQTVSQAYISQVTQDVLSGKIDKPPGATIVQATNSSLPIPRDSMVRPGDETNLMNVNGGITPAGDVIEAGVKANLNTVGQRQFNSNYFFVWDVSSNQYWSITSNTPATEQITDADYAHELATGYPGTGTMIYTCRHRVQI